MTIGFNTLNTELSKYGIISSGNIQTDIAALRKIKQEKGESTLSIDNFAAMIKEVNKTKSHKTKNTDQTEQSQQAQGQPPSPPWESLMQSLGLEPQGSPEADFAAISAKLTEMSASATTPEQQANIASLQSQFEQFQNMAPQGAGGASGLGNLQKLAQNFAAQNTTQSDGQSGNPGFSLPWNSLLQAVGLTPQGSPQADFAAIAEKLNAMSASDTSGTQQSTIAALQAKLAQYKNQTSAMVVRG